METLIDVVDLSSKIGSFIVFALFPMAYFLLRHAVNSITAKNWKHIDGELGKLKEWVRRESAHTEATVDETMERIRSLETQVSVMSERNAHIVEKINDLSVGIGKLGDKIDKQTEAYINTLEKK